MSHFTVAVISKPNQDIESAIHHLLAPFSENLELEPYISSTKEEIIEEGKREKQNILNNIQLAHDNMEEYEVSSYLQPFLDASTDEELYKATVDYNGYETDDDGNSLSTYNPNSKWDWYSIGGRWSGSLKLKDSHKTCNSAPICEVDFSLDQDEYKEAMRTYDIVVNKAELTPDEDPNDFRYNFYRPEYYSRYGSAENYAKAMSSFSTFAALTPDGEWLEKGSMGWFGMSSETTEESYDWDVNFVDKIIKQYNPSYIITIVDCHI